METISFLVDFFLHLDKHMGEIIKQYGSFSYALLFAVVFAETGFVITPFLPGDSLLFAAGTFAALGSFDILWLYIILLTAAILGDNCNYWIGRFIGPKVFARPDSKFLKKEYLDKTHSFYEKHGGKAIIIAKFMPIFRTFTPFVAGIGAMSYKKFLFYNVTSAIIWVTIFTLGGYFFGNLPFVQKNFSVVIVGIIFISVLPGVIEYLKHRKK